MDFDEFKFILSNINELIGSTNPTFPRIRMLIWTINNSEADFLFYTRIQRMLFLDSELISWE